MNELTQGLRVKQIDIIDNERYHHLSNRKLENLNQNYLNTIKIRRKGKFYRTILKKEVNNV